MNPEYINTNECNDELCRENDPVGFEVSEQEERAFANLVEVADAWEEELGRARQTTVELFEAVEEKIAHDTYGPRNQRNQGHRDLNRTQPGYFANYRMRALEAINKHLEEHFGDESVPNRSLVGVDAMSLHAYREAITGFLPKAEGRTIPVNYDLMSRQKSKTFEEPFSRVFVRELQSRAELALLIAEYPEFSRQVMLPENFANLPQSLQRFAALDIGRGPGSSLILGLFANNREAQETLSAEDAVSVIARNGLPEHTRSTLRTLALGACAAGAPDCPANSFGLCSQVIQGINFDREPSAKRDILNWKAKQSKLIIDGLIMAAERAPQTSRWWRSNGRVEVVKKTSRNIKERVTKGFRQSPQIARGTTFKDVQASLATIEVAPKQFELPPMLDLVWSNSGEVISIKTDSEAERAALVGKIVASRMFTNYAAKYRDEANLPNALQAGVEAILFEPAYHNNAAITPLPYIPEVSDRTRPGVSYPLWRLSVRDIPGDNGLGSKVIRDSRIYFGFKSDSQTRTVFMVGPRHKSDVAHKLRRRQPI